METVAAAKLLAPSNSTAPKGGKNEVDTAK
jgi:hypothetical protein